MIEHHINRVKGPERPGAHPNHHPYAPKKREKMEIARPKLRENPLRRELANAKKLREYFSRIREGTKGDDLSSGLTRRDFLPKMKGARMKQWLERAGIEFTPKDLTESLEKAYAAIARKVGISEKTLPAQAYDAHRVLRERIQEIRNGVADEARNIAPAIKEIAFEAVPEQAWETLMDFERAGFSTMKTEDDSETAPHALIHSKNVEEASKKIEALQKSFWELSNPAGAAAGGPNPKFREALPKLGEMKAQAGILLYEFSKERVDALAADLDARYRASLAEEKPEADRPAARAKAEASYKVWQAKIQELRGDRAALAKLKQNLTKAERLVRALNAKVSKTVLPACNAALEDLLGTEELREQPKALMSEIDAQIEYLEAQKAAEAADGHDAFFGIPGTEHKKILEARAELLDALRAMKADWSIADEAVGAKGPRRPQARPN